MNGYLVMARGQWRDVPVALFATLDDALGEAAVVNEHGEYTAVAAASLGVLGEVSADEFIGAAVVEIRDGMPFRIHNPGPFARA